MPTSTLSSVNQEKKGKMMNKQEIKFNELPYYLSIYMIVDKENDCVKVEIHSRIHVNKVTEMPNSWSIDYVDSYPRRFRADILAHIIKRYGLQTQPVTYM